MAKRKPEHKTHKVQPGGERATRGGTTFSWMVLTGRYRFAALFTLSCIFVYALVYALPDSFTRPFNEHTALTLGLILNFFGLKVAVVNDIVSKGGLAFKIVPECTPIFTIGLFINFVIFYPAAYRQKAAALLMGIPALYLGNLVRLAATFMVSLYDKRLFEIFHVYLGQVFTISMIVLACLFWIKWTEMKGSGQRLRMNAIIFAVRLAVISGCLFLVWMKLHHWYMWSIDRLIAFGFSLFDYHINLALNHAVYYETFSIVTFTSLVLAFGKIEWATKIRILAAGAGFLFFTHLFHRTDNALIAYFNFTGALSADLTLLVIGQYLLPVLLLTFFLFKSGLSKRS